MHQDVYVLHSPASIVPALQDVELIVVMLLLSLPLPLAAQMKFWSCRCLLTVAMVSATQACH